MRLFADRFITHASWSDDNGGYALDLASRARVRIALAPAGTVAEQREWLMHCEQRVRVRQGAAARLLDYGCVSETRRFEASLEEHGWTQPDADRQLGPAVALIERPATTALAAMLDPADDRRVRVAACWGPPGSGRRTVAEQLARLARTRGFIPVSSAELGRCLSLVTGRTLFVIDSAESSRPDGSPWLIPVLRAARPHVCLLIRREEVRGVDGFALERVSDEALIAAVVRAGHLSESRVRRAAEQAHGLPGRFVRALFPSTRCPPNTAEQALPRIAEQPAVYGSDRADDGASVDASAFASPRLVPAWPAPGELAALRRRAATATALIDSGRCAPGVRGLRQTMSAFARRAAWTDASRTALTLGAALLERGRPREAQRVLTDAGEWVTRDGNPEALVDVAILTGTAWIDLARLDEAERVLSGALTAAKAALDRDRMLSATTALSRCLLWRGKFADARACVEATSDAADAVIRIRQSRAAARAAAAIGDSSQALSIVDDVRTIAADHAAGRWLVDVDYSAACVHLTIGNLEGVDRDAAACLARARELRRPMRALGARLLLAEANRRRGRPVDAVQWAALRRLATAAPPLIKTRFELLGSIMQAPDGYSVLRRQVAATGLKGLELFASSLPRVPGSVASEPFVEDVIGILRVCQHADDELAVLADVCVRVREQLHAATAAFLLPADRRFEVLVSDGPRMDAAEIAERAITSRMAIAPHRIRERLDAAAPVQYGGNVLGALCVRWTAGTPYDLSRSSAVLTMAATAAAPVLSSTCAKRAHAKVQPVDLLGATPAMAELRQAIERAAAAPFPVLIEGESGSGKEVVAKAIHRGGLRRDRPFATLNCAALPEDLVEAELFGHTRGAFTGAAADRPGVFEEAHGGTLFLDEVGELSLRAQAKLLRAIQEGEVRRLGENLSRRVDVRIVCATNRNLRDELEAGRFRHDLLYRLDVVRITVPALRERREDVAVLVEHYWNEATRRVASRATLAADTRAALSQYDWPGNVRELQNVLAALAVRSPRRGVILPSALPPHVAIVERVESWHLEAARRSFEEGFVRAALMRSGGQRARAAAELGVTRQGLNKLMTRLGIE
jgi:DNA-binding NtrC family response regulator